MKPKQFIQHALGLIVIALGIVLIVLPKLGASPLDALCYFIYKITPLSLGTVAILVGTIATILAYVLGSKKHIIISYLALLLMGTFVDVWKFVFQMLIQNPDQLMFVRIIMATLGILVVSLGVAMTITSGLSPLPYERLLILLNKKIKNLGLSKIMIESTFLVLAITMGLITGLLFEQINVLTIVVVFTIGPCIHLFEKIIKRYQILKGENYEFELND